MLYKNIAALDIIQSPSAYFIRYFNVRLLLPTVFAVPYFCYCLKMVMVPSLFSLIMLEALWGVLSLRLKSTI